MRVKTVIPQQYKQPINMCGREKIKGEIEG